MTEQKDPPVYRYRISAIPCAEVPPEVKHLAVINGVKALGLGPFREPKPLNFKHDGFDLGEISIRNFKFPFNWVLNTSERNPHLRDVNIQTPEDHLTADDRMGAGVLFKRQKDGRPAFSWIVNEMAPIMILAMDAYRMDVEPSDLFSFDMTGIMEEGWKFYRWKVGGLKPISFYDDRLCLSAFGVDAGEVARRVSGVVPYVKVIPLRNRNGVLIQAVDDYVETEEFLPVRDRIMAAIRGTKAGA